MFTRQQLENILFVDIETVSQVKQLEELSDTMQRLWIKKSKKYQKNNPEAEPGDLFSEKAGIHAEFAKTICISCGYVKLNTDGGHQFTIKSYAGHDERSLLKEFGEMLNKFTQKEGRKLCAHNGKEFDFPFLGRRYLIHGLSLPDVLQIQGKKPWELSFIDTMELWRFGEYKSFISLELLATVLGIPSPKDDIDGSSVNNIYWHEQDLNRIQTYCEKDVKTTGQILLKMCHFPLTTSS